MAGIETFELNGSVTDGSDLSVSLNKYSFRKGDFAITLSGHGFEASHYMMPYRLRELRDWINAALGEAPLSDYDAGLLNDFGGGNVEWWQDYIRAEIGRANEFWRTQVEGS